jgi:hypothetical protein
LVELVDGGRDVWQHQIIYSHHEGHESSITERGGKEREEYMHKGYPPLPIEQGRRKGEGEGEEEECLLKLGCDYSVFE